MSSWVKRLRIRLAGVPEAAPTAGGPGRDTAREGRDAGVIPRAVPAGSRSGLQLAVPGMGQGRPPLDDLMSDGAGDALVEVLIILLFGLRLPPALQRVLEHLVHGLHELELQELLDVLWNVRQVLLVVARQDDGADTQAVCREDLLLHPADRQD